MKIMLSLTLFAHNKASSWILVERYLDKYRLPTEEISSLRLEAISRWMIKGILGIDWTTNLRQECFCPKDDHVGHIVYSLFLEDKINITGDAAKYKWLKLSEIDQIDDFYQNILKTALTKRF